MTLNLTQLKDLSCICQIAREGLEPEYGLPREQTWIERIDKYRQLFEAEIDRLEADAPYPVEFEPHFDPTREGFPFSGILVRARLPDGSFGSVDLAHLNRKSFFKWLRSRGGDNLWAEATVAHLLGYELEGTE